MSSRIRRLAPNGPILTTARPAHEYSRRTGRFARIRHRLSHTTSIGQSPGLS